MMIIKTLKLLNGEELREQGELKLGKSTDQILVISKEPDFKKGRVGFRIVTGYGSVVYVPDHAVAYFEVKDEI